MIGAKGLQAHHPRALGLIFQALAKPRQEAVERGQNVFFQPDGLGETKPDRETRRRGRGADRFGLMAHGLIQPHYQIATKTARQSCAGLAQEVSDLADAKAEELGLVVLRQAQSGDRQIRERGIGLPRRGNPVALGRKLADTRGRAATFPVAALDGAGSCGAGLLVDGVSAAQLCAGLACVTRQGPGRADRIGDACLHREAQCDAIVLHLGQHRLLSAIKMRAACDVDQQAIGGLFRHPGRELARPAPEGCQEQRLRARILQARQHLGAHGLSIAQRLVVGQPCGLRMGVHRGDHLHLAGVAQHNKGPLRQHWVLADQPFGPQSWEPQRKHTSFGHWAAMFHFCSAFLA